MRAFAREACRNDILNFGRLHFFFPDSRLALDLNTDRTLKEVCVDRSLNEVCVDKSDGGRIAIVHGFLKPYLWWEYIYY